MSEIETLSNWIIANQDKKGTPDFEVVANALIELSDTSDPLVDDVFKLQELPEEAPIETDFIDEIEETVKGIGGGAVNILESAALGAITPFGEDTESELRETILSIGGAAKSLFEADKGSENLVGRKFGEALGSFAGILGAAAIPGVGLPAAAALAIGAGAGEASERARAGGATESERAKASGLGALVGATELISPIRIVRAFKRGVGDEVAETIFTKGKRILREAGVEGTQEFLAGVGQNLIEQNIYNPDKGTFTGTGEALGYGAGVGGFVQAVMEVIAPYRARGRTTEGAPDETEQTKLLEDQRRLQLEDQRPTVDFGPRLEEGQIQGELFADPLKNIEGDPNIVEPEAKPEPEAEIKDDIPVQRDMIEELEDAQLKGLIDADENAQLRDMLAKDEEAAIKQLKTKSETLNNIELKQVATRLENKRKAETATKRNTILDEILATSDTASQVNTEKTFSKALADAGIANTTPNPQEKAKIARKTYEIEERKKGVADESPEFQRADRRFGKERVPKTEIPSLEKEVKAKAVLPKKLSATASQDVAPVTEKPAVEPVVEPAVDTDELTTEQKEMIASGEANVQKIKDAEKELYKGVTVKGKQEAGGRVTTVSDGKKNIHFVRDANDDNFYRSSADGMQILNPDGTVNNSGFPSLPISDNKKDASDILARELKGPTPDAEVDTAARPELQTPEKKLTEDTKRKKARKKPSDDIGETLGFTKKDVKRQISKKIDPKKLAERFEKGQATNIKKTEARDKKQSVEALKEQGITKPTTEQITKETKKRKERVQSKRDTKSKIDAVTKDIKLTEKRKINEKQLATFVQEDVTQKDRDKTNVIKPTAARVAADNIEFYMKEFPNQDATTQLSTEELQTVLDLVSNPPSSADIANPSRDKTGRAAAYVYFSKQGNPRDVLDVVAHDIFFAPKQQDASDYESKASREYFYNSTEQNALLARKWIDSNLGKSQVKIQEGETVYKLDFTNVDYEKNTPNIDKLKKLGYTDKEIRKIVPINPETGKPIPRFDRRTKPKKKEVSTPNITFVPANKTLYDLIQKEANNYLAMDSNEALVSLGVSRRGDAFKAETLKTIQEQREATAPNAVIYNTNEVVSGHLPPDAKNPTPEIKGLVFVKDGKEVFGPFPEGVNHPLKDVKLKDYKFIETSAVNGLDIPVHPVVNSLLSQGKLHEALVALGNSTANKRVAQIARALSKVSGTTKVKVVKNLTADNSGKEVSGKFDPKTNTIFLDADTGINSHVILHEMTHAATTEVLANKSSQEVKKLTVLFNSVKGMLDTAYGAQNLDEFVAETFSNPEFQQKLAGMNYKNTNGLQTFFNTIGNFVRKLLGMQTKDINTALNESDQLIQDILSPAPEFRNAGELLLLNGKERIKRAGDYIANKYEQTKSGETKQQFQERLTSVLNSKAANKLKTWILRSLPLKAVSDQNGELNKKAIARLKEELNNATTDAEKKAIQEKLAILRNNTAMQINDAILDLEGELGKADKEVEGTLKKLEPWIVSAKKSGKLEAWNDVIHDSTIEGVDPTAPEDTYKNDPEKLATYKQLKTKLYGLGGDAVRNYINLKNAYETQFEQLKKVLETRIAELTDQATFSKFKKDVFNKIFDKAAIRPYFPLFRKGDYWLRYEIPVTKSDGTTTTELVVEAFEGSQARFRRMNELKEGKVASNIEPYTNVTTSNFNNVPPTSFVGEVIDLLKKSNVDQTTQDGILNLFIDVLPESSFAKGFKKREGILGAKKDAYEVLREKGFDIGRQTARMLHGAKIAKLQRKLEDETKAFRFDKEGEARVRVQAEMSKRADFARNPPPDHMASLANRLAFIGTIGFNVSSAIVNFSQIPLMFYPVLGGQYGLKEANSALGLSTRLFVGSGLSRKMKTLNGDNVDAKGSVSIDNYFEADGANLVVRKDLEAILNKTQDGKQKLEQLNKIIPLIVQAQNHGQLGRSLFYDTLNIESAGKTRTAWDTINAWSAWTFHHMERMNRQVALVATYNLELDRLNKKPNSKEQDLSPTEKQELAAKNAIYLTTEMNGGATLSTTSGIAQQGIGRVAMMYKGYGMQMYYTMYTRARDAIRKASDPDLTAEENKQLKKAAIKQVSGILTSSFLLAGVQGMPLVGGALFIRNLFKDDDEEDAETELRTFIGEGFYKGPINYFGGVDVASRIGLSNLLFRANPYRDPDASLTDQLAELLTGPAGSMANQVYRGIQELKEGELERAGMNFVPAAIRNMYKAAIKYPTEGGILTRRGDVIYDDLNAWETGAQFFGFAPAEYTKTQEMNRSTKTQDRDIVSQSTKLLKKYYVAIRMGDDTQDILEDILEYNRKFPSVAITPDSILRSMRMHMKTSLLMDRGITLSPKLRAYLLAQRDEWSPASLYDED